ncbi:hypothetical protein [Aquibacillus albus]|uniref:Uncharacterized protein n=1 Tax=Aquibacillus albus TaxID=1168171 RepID=A0ABS2N6F2_9BACI|nr:hypothetical protein [Aquibacillus albus]MBM7573688.1 hypothetical protein [Aquibacillus albus]
MKKKVINSKYIKHSDKPIEINSSSIKRKTIKRSGGCCMKSG